MLSVVDHPGGKIPRGREGPCLAALDRHVDSDEENVLGRLLVIEDNRDILSDHRNEALVAKVDLPDIGVVGDGNVVIADLAMNRGESLAGTGTQRGSKGPGCAKDDLTDRENASCWEIRCGDVSCLVEHCGLVVDSPVAIERDSHLCVARCFFFFCQIKGKKSKKVDQQFIPCLWFLLLCDLFPAIVCLFDGLMVWL